jgi:aspartyl-tRNA(Asn)/glutamyl-tRNA(Gln) amidotransferase subunit C
MSDAERVSLDDVHRVAELANLDLTPDEQSRMRRDLNAILDHVAQLAQLDTAHIPPMAQVSEVLTASAETVPEKFSENVSVLRDDLPRPCLPRDQVMSSAPETDGTCFKVPKVIER